MSESSPAAPKTSTWEDFLDVFIAPVQLVLSRVELFALWATVLVGIGLKQIARTTTGQAAAGAMIVWLVGALPFLFQVG